MSDVQFNIMVATLADWQVKPSGTLGYNKAEVTLGGVDTRELSSKTMEATGVPGLFFIGEVIDVTGHLGGFNFQWAWASGVAAERPVNAPVRLVLDTNVVIDWLVFDGPFSGALARRRARGTRTGTHTAGGA